jgi:diaminopimelate decarboxylase
MSLHEAIRRPGDFMGLERELTGIHVGAVLAVHGAGAYGFPMSSNYNSRPRAAEVLVDADRWTITRDRETMMDLLRGERSLEEISDADWRGARGGAV